MREPDPGERPDDPVREGVRHDEDRSHAGEEHELAPRRRDRSRDRHERASDRESNEVHGQTDRDRNAEGHASLERSAIDPPDAIGVARDQLRSFLDGGDGPPEGVSEGRPGMFGLGQDALDVLSVHARQYRAASRPVKPRWAWGRPDILTSRLRGAACIDCLVRDPAEPCLLCRRVDRPITREHVFPRWLVRQVHGSRLVSSDTSRPGPSAAPPTRISRVTADVCADCNTGWMSVLEDSFQRAVFARPRVGTLPAPDRVTLSRWFTKTAVLLAHAHGASLVTGTERQQLVGGMPAGVEVFLARRRRPRQHLDFALGATVDDGGDTRRVRSVTILVDELVGQVTAHGTLASRHGTRLWPLRSHTMRWDTLPVR